MAKTKEDIGAVFKEEFRGLIEGAQADVDEYAEVMAAAAIEAAATGNERLLRHLKAQAKTLGASHQISATDAAWDTAGRLLSMGVRMLIALSLVVMVACGAPRGSIPAAGIQDSVIEITLLYDEMLDGEVDPSTFTALERAAYHNTAKMLRDVVGQAVASGRAAGLSR